MPMTKPDISMDLIKFFHDLGTLLIIDDIKDVGKFSFDGHPSPFHHWQLGYVMKELCLYAGQAMSWIKAWEEAGREMQEDFLTELSQMNKTIDENIQNFPLKSR